MTDLEWYTPTRIISVVTETESESWHELTNEEKQYMLFSEKLPLIGWVPLEFYFPKYTHSSWTEKVKKHGGHTTPIVECFTYQISLLPMSALSDPVKIAKDIKP